MKRYRILQRIILGFDAPQEQQDCLFGPEDQVILESNGHTIWVVVRNKRHESITIGHAITVWLQEGRIQEIASEGP